MSILYHLRNADKTPFGVNHADLKRAHPRSDFKSLCPVEGCTGNLQGRRGKDRRMLADDHCFACNQRVKYLDIARLRRQDKGIVLDHKGPT